MVGIVTFSVVIAAYEAENTVGAAISSVLTQTRQDFEIIVVDDGSRDGTAAAVEELAAGEPRVRLHRQANAGPSAARNKGVELGRGELVSMLDSDDLWLPRYLAEMGGALERNPGAGFAYTDAWLLEATSNRILKVTAMQLANPPGKSLPNERFVAALIRRNFIFNAVTVRRSVLDRVGGYDTSMSFSEDYELWLRMAVAGVDAVRVQGPLAIKRDRPGSLTHQRREMADGQRAAVRAIVERTDSPPRARELAQARLRDDDAAQRRRASLVGRTLLRARNTLAAATWGPRRRLIQLAAPPPEVAAAFPELGRGRSPRRRG